MKMSGILSFGTAFSGTRVYKTQVTKMTSYPEKTPAQVQARVRKTNSQHSFHAQKKTRRRAQKGHRALVEKKAHLCWLFFS